MCSAPAGLVSLGQCLGRVGIQNIVGGWDCRRDLSVASLVILQSTNSIDGVGLYFAVQQM